ncbi:hypothetical protein HID58_053103, partial [Brassica napus]
MKNTTVEPLGKSKNLSDLHQESLSIGFHRKSSPPPNHCLPPHEEARRTTNDDSVLEERDPQYDTMLNQMVGNQEAKLRWE